MTGPLHESDGARHQETQSLLPWYVTGQLDVSDRAQVEAHLAECAQCQDDLGLERRMKAAFIDLPVGVEHGWTTLQRRLRLGRPEATRGAGIRDRLRSARREAARQAGRGWRGGAPRLGWALAGVQILALSVIGVSMLSGPRPARYHALGASPAPAAGNVVVMFRPETREKNLRETIEAGHARLVDGPTAAGAWVLHVPASERAAALATLRGRPDIVLAEPIDAGQPS